MSTACLPVFTASVNSRDSTACTDHYYCISSLLLKAVHLFNSTKIILMTFLERKPAFGKHVLNEATTGAPDPSITELNVLHKHLLNTKLASRRL